MSLALPLVAIDPSLPRIYLDASCTRWLTGQRRPDLFSGGQRRSMTTEPFVKRRR